MRKADAAVALLGALALAAATAAVAVVQPSGAAEADFRVAVERALLADERIAPAAPAEPATDRGLVAVPFRIDPGEASVEVARFAAFANATPGFPTGASLLLRVTSPEGVTREAEGAAAPGGASVSATLEFPVSAAPGEGTVRAASLDEAQASLDAARPAVGAGNWTIEASFASAGPVPPPSVAWTLAASAYGWSARADPAPPGAR